MTTNPVIALRADLFQQVQDLAADALASVASMPNKIANPALLDMTDLLKAQEQLAAIQVMKDDVATFTAGAEALYQRIAGFLMIDAEDILTAEDLTGLGLRRSAELAEKLTVPESATETDDAASSGKYREAIRKSVAKTHSNVTNKGNNLFGSEDGSYWLGYPQKSGSTANELKFTVTVAVVNELKADDGSLYLVCRDGLIAEVKATQLNDKPVPRDRYELVVCVKDGSATRVKGPKKEGWEIDCSGFSVSVASE